MECKLECLIEGFRVVADYFVKAKETCDHFIKSRETGDTCKPLPLLLETLAVRPNIENPWELEKGENVDKELIQIHDDVEESFGKTIFLSH